ncbi:MAG: hypothetical protein WDN00_18765 [Limisphaerales bacterium]
MKICAAVLSLLIIGFIIWRVNLAHEVNVKLQTIRAAGLPTSGAELNAYYPAVPDNENAALVMTQAFVLLRNYPDSRSNEVARFKIPPRLQSLNAQQNQLLTGYVEMNSNALARVREAVKFPKSRYPVDLTLNADALLPHLPNLQKISAIVSFATMLALKAQDGKQAADWISLQIALNHTLNTEPLLISQINRAKIVSSASQLVELGLNTTTFDEETLLGFATNFEQIDRSDRSAIGFIGDQAMLLPYFQANWSEISRVMWANDLRPSLSTGIRGRFGWLTGLFDQDELFYLKTMQTAIDEIKLPFPAGQSSYDEIYEAAVKGQQAGYILGPGLLNGMRNAIPREAETCAQIRLTVTALAIERFRLAHGQLPESLDELVPQFLSSLPLDPFDGQPLRYRRLTKGYVIYSIGRDDHDNNGRERPANIKSSDKTEYDITFTVER